MARALALTAGTIVLACVASLVAGLQDTEGASAGETVQLTAFFAVLFAVSAVLFARAAQARDDAAYSGQA